MKHKRLGVALGVAAAAFVTSGIWMLAAQPVRADERLTNATVASEPVTDAELLDAAAAEPKISLGESDTQPKPELESYIDVDDVPAGAPLADEDRPEWIDAQPAPNQRVFTAGPFATRGPHTAPPEFNNWVWDLASVQQPDLGASPPGWWGDALDEIAERTRVATHLERRETSVGTVYLHHTLAEVDDDDREWLLERSEEWLAQSRSERGVRNVTLGGGALLAGVAVLHGFLRSGRRSAPPAA